MSSSQAPAPPTDVRHIEPRRGSFPAAVFVAILLVLLTWTLATPLFGSPDEPAHLYKAYGTAHGEAIGEPIEGSFSPNLRRFDVPSEMGVPPTIMCFIFQADVSAGCVQPGPGSAGDSTAATYPPFWYGLVGGGARLTGHDTSQRAYRAVGAALCAALIAAAFAVARRSPAGRLSPLLLLALTPMTLFLGGSVNPNGFEIAGFLLLWALCLHVGSERAPGQRSGVIVGSIVAVLLLSRFASAIWVATGAGVIALTIGLSGVRRFLNRAFLVPALGLSAAASALLVVWSRFAGAVADDPRIATDMSLADAARTTWERTPELLRQMIGILGWLDTRIPWFAYTLFAVFTAVIVAGVVFAADRRLVLATGAVCAGVIVVPILVNVASAASAGLIWQGRYSLPLYAMLGMLGMLGWHRALERRPNPRLLTAVRWTAATCFVVAEVASFWQSMRRFTVGAGGKIWLDEPLPWRPSIAPMPLIAINAVLVAMLAGVVLAGTARDHAAANDDEPAIGRDPLTGSSGPSSAGRTVTNSHEHGVSVASRL